MRRPVLVLLLSTIALTAVACRSSKPEAAPVTTMETTTVPSTTSTTLRPTTTGPPRTTTTTIVTLGPGDASIGGTVTGPAGPVDGATVRVERLVGKAVATADVTTAGGGAWHMPSILGGSYRVWAFKAPDLAQSPVESFFLAANERRTLDFKVTAASGEKITSAVTPSPPRLAQPATLTVAIGIGRVDDQGRPTLTPRPGVVMTLSASPGYAVESAPQATTDANGAASWRIRCLVEGANAVPLTVGTGVTQVDLPACAAPGAPVPTAPAASATTRPS